MIEIEHIRIVDHSGEVLFEDGTSRRKIIKCNGINLWLDIYENPNKVGTCHTHIFPLSNQLMLSYRTESDE